MTEAKEPAKEQTKADFVSIDTIPIILTYEFGDSPTVIKFKCNIAYTADDRAARQAYYALPDGDKDKGAFRFNVDMLSRIVSEIPEGLPGFEVRGSATATPEAGQAASISAAIKEYFGTGEPILQKIAADAIDRYNVLSQPAEFFR